MSQEIVLVIGGGRGIGEAISMAAAQTGKHVVLTYQRDQERALSVVERVRNDGGEATALKVDVSEENDIRALFATVDLMGRLDSLVYNSGVTGGSSSFAEASTETLDYVIAVNLRGAMIAAQEAVRRLSTARGGRGGSIVFISSRATAYGSPGEHVWYAASKGGVDALSLGLAREVATEGIRINTVSPGLIATTLHQPGKLRAAAGVPPMKRAGMPDEVAAAVLFLLSNAASYITGANLAVSGGR